MQYRRREENIKTNEQYSRKTYENIFLWMLYMYLIIIIIK